MNRSFLLLGSLCACAGVVTSLANCGGDNGTGDGGADVSVSDAPVKDTASHDVTQSMDAGNDVTINPPSGTELAPSDHAQVFGITSDGYVIYADASQANALFSVSLTGGAATKIASPTVSSTVSYNVGVAGKMVFLWQGISTAKGAAQVGSLSTWSSTQALTLASAKSAPGAGFAVSADGTHAIFNVNPDIAGATGDFVVAKVDGTDQVSLVTGVDIGTNDCHPLVGFASNTTVVAATCAVIPGDGGTPSATVSSFVLGAGGDGGISVTMNPLATGAFNLWSPDTAGDMVFTATPTALTVYPTAGGAGTPIDTKNIYHLQGQLDWSFLYLNKAGTTAWYSTPAGALYRSSVSAPSPMTVQASGVNYVRSVSANEGYIIYTTTLDALQFGGDLYLTTTGASAAAPTTLGTGTTNALFGLTSADNFTADSQYVMWIENLDENQGIGDLYVMPTAGGSAKMVTTAEWQNFTATGSKIVFNDNCQGCSGSSQTQTGTADIKSVDLSTSNSPTLLQASADETIFLSPDKTHVIFTYSQNPMSSGVPATGGNGLYVIAIP